MRSCLITGAALLLAGCGSRPEPGDEADQAAQRGATKAAEDAVASTRLQVAEGRLDRLERRLAELEAAPTGVDAALLKQRLTATEAALASASLESAPEPARTPRPSSSGTPAVTRIPRPQATATATPTPQATPRLRLVDPAQFTPERR